MEIARKDRIGNGVAEFAAKRGPSAEKEKLLLARVRLQAHSNVVIPNAAGPLISADFSRLLEGEGELHLT